MFLINWIGKLYIVQQKFDNRFEYFSVQIVRQKKHFAKSQSRIFNMCAVGNEVNIKNIKNIHCENSLYEKLINGLQTDFFIKEQKYKIVITDGLTFNKFKR